MFVILALYLRFFTVHLIVIYMGENVEKRVVYYRSWTYLKKILRMGNVYTIEKIWLYFFSYFFSRHSEFYDWNIYNKKITLLILRDFPY